LSRPPIHNPRGVPVVGDDAHLPSLDLARLSESAMRERFRKLPEWAPEFRGDGALFVDHGPAQAAVLVGLVPRDGALRVLFTQRTAHLRKHAGQVSFPGGRSEAEDGAPAVTALREAHEEIGLEPHRVDVLGVMPTYTTVTNFVVTPVVGIVVQPPAAYRPDPREVDAVFEVPLPFLMTPAHHRRHRFEWDGNSREFLSMTWRDPVDGAEHFIWGATAAMVRNLYRLLAA
jgi:8-oxo-dGTP pyrophosphatase MutT (NUDIX family)